MCLISFAIGRAGLQKKDFSNIDGVIFWLLRALERFGSRDFTPYPYVID
jgi:hypothetical protein